MKKLGQALLVAPGTAFVGLLVWYSLLSGGVVGLHSDPKAFAIAGAIVGFIVAMVEKP